MQNLLPDPSVFPAAPFYACPPTPTPGPSQTISTTQTQNPLTMPTPSTLSRVRRRTRGRQAPVSPDGKAVKYRSKNGELKNRLSICPAAACAVRFSRNEHLTRHVKCMHTDDEGAHTPSILCKVSLRGYLEVGFASMARPARRPSLGRITIDSTCGRTTQIKLG
ncbi:hypothetical protein M404DRAFT_428606 [Pisolithus tinctorius Marx 270]|uniref:C2H2-type domain-containing protein n=1 Tax=Pisolithus tinctorius Marx 270 TaxID=870435 RepID=A0A0C3PFL7_PISTI|nr:hypothetical protein M404DRAFT_428606 [Pisolithus tinctorius Marx 270]